ncbi:MAG: response regulator [Bacteroidaceae bacterium]|nr:response regulator [Bacteroidaceae bacterium]
MKKIRFVAVFAFLIASLCISAQYARLYTTQNGLKSSALYSTQFDSKGMAWITGIGTLQLFEGTTFIDVLKDKGELANAVFHSVKEYKDDRYWLVTSRGLHLYDMHTNSVKHVVISSEEAEMEVPLNRMIDYPKTDYALITTSGFGLFVFDMDAQRVDSVLTRQLTSLIGVRLYRDVMIDEEECLWGSGVGQNLFCVDLNTMLRKELTITPEAQAVLERSNVQGFCEWRGSHRLLIATNEGMLVYDRTQQCVRTLRGPAVPRMTISRIMQTHDGRILVGTDSHGLWQLDNHEVLTRYRVTNQQIDLSYAKIRSIDEDAGGNIIIGIYQKGVLLISDISDNFVYLPVSLTSRQANVACVTSIAADRQGNYWMGTDGCGVFRSSKTDLTDAVLYDEGLTSLQVQVIKVDREGTVWVGTFGGGIQRLQGNRFVTPDWLQSLGSQFVMTMAYDAARHCMYIGTNGNGVLMLDLATHEITPLMRYGEFNPWTVALYCDPQGVVWCGTVSQTFWFNPVTRLLREVTFADSLQVAARAFAADGDDMLIGSNIGLYRYDAKQGKARVIASDLNVMSVETTPSNLWVATADAIVRLDRKNNKPYTYTSFDGYYIGEFHKMASFQSSSHVIYYGGDNGVIAFNAQHLQQLQPLQNVLILTSLKVNGENYDYSELRSDNMLDSSLRYATELTVPYDQNTLAFTFSVPNFSTPNRIFYRYRLEGYERNWHEVMSAHEAYYASLPPGSYRLVIQAYYETGEQAVIERALDICVRRPWYASWWAWCIYLLLALLAAYYLYNTYRIRQRQRQLLSQVRHNEQIKEAKLRMFTSIAHEMKSPLTMIVSPLRQLMSEAYPQGEKKGNVQEADRQSLYKMMNMNCDRLLRIIKQVTDIRKIDSGQFKLHFSEVDFATYADEIFKSFSGYAVSKRISFVIEHGDNEARLWLDREHFEKILSNLLSNAFKFTPEGGRVIVRTRPVKRNNGDWFEIRVYNSGSSIAPTDLPHIFERFYQAPNGESLKMGSGIGLNLATELVNLHHGTITATNVDPDGVEFILHFPLGSSHLGAEERTVAADSSEFAEYSEYSENSEFSDYSELSESSDSPGHQPLVLVVDDDESLCHYVTDILHDHYRVVEAYDGNSAWQQILTQRPDAVVTDIRMPLCDGIELCRRIRNNPDTDNLPIIILTSESSDRTHIYSLNLDVDHFINKPFNPLMLQGAVAHSIRVRERIVSRLRRTEVGFDYNETTIDSPDDRLFSRVIQAIKAHIDDTSFGVNELANEVGISRVQLGRKMKERYGMSPVSFIRSYRLKQSAYLLVNNQVSISDVAYRMGFSSHPYFSNVFREYFGMSPKEFVAYYADSANEDMLQKLLE